MKRAAVCVHCRKGTVNRPRGLCWTCYYAPGVRDLHPSTSKHAPHCPSNGPGREPTMAELDAMVAEQVRNLPDWWHEPGD